MIHFALQFEIGGKKFSHPLSVSKTANFATLFSEYKCLCVASVCKSKKEAADVSAAWNRAAVESGTYYYEQYCF
jgi:hypothetical protein